MKAAVATDGEGWVRALYTFEGKRPRQGDEHPVDQEMAQLVDAHEVVKVEAGRLAVPYDDRQALLRYRQLGVGGADALERVRALRGVRGRFQDAGAAPDRPLRHAGLRDQVLAFAEVPGLTLVPFGVEALATIAPAAVDAGIYPATCPDADCGCTPPEAHPWLMLAARLDNHAAYQFRLDFNGRPLQHEVIVRDVPHRATFALTFHHTRERPSWFWREAERPVFETMQRDGITLLESRTRLDRPDWIASLKANYGAVEIGRGEAVQRLRFPVDLAFTGWPARTQVGFDQTTGRVRVWEATAADLPAVRQLLQTVPAGQRALVLQMLEEWWHLDRATVLLGALDGALRYARAIRIRRGALAALAYLGPMHDEPEQALVTAQLRLWARAAGYTQVSSFIPDRLLATSQMQAQMARGQVRELGKRPFREGFTEVVTDV